MWTLPPELWPKILPLTVKDFSRRQGALGTQGRAHVSAARRHGPRALFGDSARAAFEARLREFPDRAQLHELLGRALALGGHRAEAIAEAERSLALRETSLDVALRPYVHFQVARILVQSGEYDKALDLIEPLFTTSRPMSRRPTCGWIRRSSRCTGIRASTGWRSGRHPDGRPPEDLLGPMNKSSRLVCVGQTEDPRGIRESCRSPQSAAQLYD